jgi:hypothetical protein
MLLASSVSGLFKWRQFEPEVILLAVGWYWGSCSNGAKIYSKDPVFGLLGVKIAPKLPKSANIA